jgi:signal transduction histidine kinase
MTKGLQQGNLDWLTGSDEVIKVIQSVDWEKTGIGPIELWPQNFRSILNLCLEALYPIGIYWGSEFVLFYNESWRPIAGNKHPRSFGQSGSEVWREIWDVIGPMFRSVLETGEVVLKIDQLLPLERFGYIEECYFNFNLSPIRTAEGKVEGIFNVAIESTYRVINERRTQFLQQLSSQTSTTKSAQELCMIGAKVISGNPLDIPFSLLYLMDQEEKEIILISSSGICLPHKLVPQTLPLTEQSNKIDKWHSVTTIRTGLAQKITDASIWSDILKDGYWPEKPKEAWCLPIPAIGSNGIMGILIVGVSPRLAFDTNYQTFFNLVCGNIASALGNARAHEEERRRTEALAEIDRVKTAFFSNVSHEFRTPLTLMLGPIEDLLNNTHGNLLPHQRPQIEVVHRNSLRLLKLVNTLLDFSRIEAKRVEAVYEAIELASFTTDLASSFRSAIEKAGMKFIIDCTPLPEIAYIDKDMWEKIVLNLISNAFKYTLEGEIKVTLRAVSTTAELIVSDTGIGIPEKELPKVFLRFHRVQGARGRTHEGTGIGLSLVQELVKLHGGRVEVKSTLGKGTAFTVSIPLGSKHIPQDKILETQKILSSTAVHTEAYVEEALRWIQTPSHPKETHIKKSVHPQETQTKEPSLKSEENRREVQRKKIVLADDNADMRDYVVKLLEERYDVTATGNGKEALEAIHKLKPDLLLSDVMMPIMDGFELLKDLRNDPNYQTIPIILLSARAGEDTKTSGIGLGADDYLTKPFSAKELQVRIQTQLNLSEMRTKLLHDLELSNKELEVFSSAVSHDLRTPLRSMAGFSKILFDEYSEVIDSKGKNYLQRIIASAHKMGLLIDGLLNLSRLSRGEIHTQMVNISKIVQSITEELQSIDPSRKVDFIIEKDVTLEGDSQLFYIALQNLISNAWKFTSKKEKGRIEFGVEIQNDKKTYFIKDNGAGFDMQFSNKLFGIFERLHSVKDFEGTGIGLATVQRVIQRHGGRIWAEGIVNQGAVFYFNFSR